MNDKPVTSSKKETLRKLRAEIDRIVDPKDPAAEDTLRTENCEIESVVPGEIHKTPAGPCYVVKTRFDLGRIHGRMRLRELFEENIGVQAEILRDDRIRNLKARDALYLDTETTGLSAADGAFAFMIGLGFFQGNEFCVWQIFSRDYGEEPAAMTELARIASHYSHLVSFNGKHFDVPLLDARFHANRIDVRLRDMVHIDLLIPARRLWKYRLPYCSLGCLEGEVLGFCRVGDIPSFDIPDLYLDYLRCRDARKLQAVFNHNSHDVVSMVVLQTRIAQLLSAGEYEGLAPEEIYALGKINLVFSRRERAFECFRSCEAHLVADLRLRAQKDMVLLLRKWKRWDEAAAILETMVAAKPESLFGYEQLAIHLEHRAKEYERALIILDAADKNVVFSGYDQKQKWEKRRARILRKMADA